MKDYYKILGVSKTAPSEEIKKAYRKLMKENHPDMTGSDDDRLSKDINEAYSILGNEDKRKKYDQQLIYSSNSKETPRTSNTSFGQPILEDLVNQFQESFNKSFNNSRISLEQEYDKFIEYLTKKDEEFKEFGLTSDKIRKDIENKRGILTVQEISQYKRNIESQLDKLKKISKLFDEFQNYYKKEKENLERIGETIPQKFDGFIDPKNRIKFSEEELKKALNELKDIVYMQNRKINNRLNELNASLKQSGWTISDILIQKRMRSSNEFTKKDIEEIEEMIELIDEIEKNLKPLNINLNSLLFQLGKSKSEMSLKELKIINKNIIENNKGLTAKWKIMHMNLDDLENSNSHKM